MRELATEHLQSGVANTASALVQLLGLVFGVEIGRSIAVTLVRRGRQAARMPPSAGGNCSPRWRQGLAFTLTLRARYRDPYVMCTATVLALVASEARRALFGRSGRRVRRGARRSASLETSPARGFGGLRSSSSSRAFSCWYPGAPATTALLQLVTDQTMNGINGGFDTFVTAISIAYGAHGLWSSSRAGHGRGGDVATRTTAPFTLGA